MNHLRKLGLSAFLVGTILCFAILFLGASTSNAAPSLQASPTPRLLEMRYVPDSRPIRIPAPRGFNPKVRAPNAMTININYITGSGSYGDNCIAWPANAQTAFSYAASLAAARFNSTVATTINACWADNLAPGVLGHGAPTTFYRDFPGAPVANTWYAYPFANALAGSDLNVSTNEIYIGYSNAFTWYYGTDANPPSGQTDLVSVAFHEILHGLGFLGSFAYGTTSCGSANSGCWGMSGYPTIYDRSVYNGSSQLLISSFVNPSAALGSQLTSNNLYFQGTNATAANGGNYAKIYAPSTYSSGSSISHLDYNAYSASELMVYAIGSGQAKHSPGPVTMGLMRDLGWPPATTTRHVTNANNSGAGSLRQAILDASAGDTIVFDGDYTINLSSEVVIDRDVVIDGTGRTITVSGGSSVRVFSTVAGTSVTLNRLNITQGSTSGNGAGVSNSGALRVTNSTFSNNNASTSNGGGIYNDGTLNIINSTFTANNASQGGGIYNVTNRLAEITNSTLSGNTATNGGGVYGAGPYRINNSIIANHGAAGNCGGTYYTGVSGNVHWGDESCPGATSGDPKLGALANNGGGSQTMKLGPESAAIDAATVANCPTTDQRGQTRDDLNCDAGAYELKIADGNWVQRGVSSSAQTTFGPTVSGIQRDASFTDPGIITVTKQTSWTGGTPSNTLGAWWSISPTVSSGISLTLRLCYTTAELGGLSEASLRFWRYSGASWTDAGAPPSAPSGNCATLPGVTQLSRWTLATSNPNNVPTAVTLSSLNAREDEASGWFAIGGFSAMLVGALAFVFARRRVVR
ncbi:MAG: hypothetical protein HY868_10550 [Chloroflexi bacterium]|nr:hypothetical protein [Chloroflexota bacterium]